MAQSHSSNFLNHERRTASSIQERNLSPTGPDPEGSFEPSAARTDRLARPKRAQRRGTGGTHRHVVCEHFAASPGPSGCFLGYVAARGLAGLLLAVEPDGVSGGTGDAGSWADATRGVGANRPRLSGRPRATRDHRLRRVAAAPTQE